MYVANHFSTSSEVVSCWKVVMRTHFSPAEQSMTLLFKLLNVEAYFLNVFQQHVRIGTKYCFKVQSLKALF